MKYTLSGGALRARPQTSVLKELYLTHTCPLCRVVELTIHRRPEAEYSPGLLANYLTTCCVVCLGCLSRLMHRSSQAQNSWLGIAHERLPIWQCPWAWPMGDAHAKCSWALSMCIAHGHCPCAGSMGIAHGHCAKERGPGSAKKGFRTSMAPPGLDHLPKLSTSSLSFDTISLGFAIFGHFVFSAWRIRRPQDARGDLQSPPVFKKGPQNRKGALIRRSWAPKGGGGVLPRRVFLLAGLSMETLDLCQQHICASSSPEKKRVF